MKAFPVELPAQPGPTVYITRGGRRRACRYTDRVSYADWHDAPRGTPAAPVRHEAQDIFGPLGADVVAPDDGRINGSTLDSGPTAIGGHWVSIRAAGRDYYLAHLRRAPLVRVGDRVQAGQRIGELGRSGNASDSCPHLHISSRKITGGVRGDRINLYDELVAVDPTEAGGERRRHAEGP